ncbi:hypothetical protein [Plantibacter sp. YIM 135347]|jgi:hypothetical protein|uniref:hypothetical protein n=1 Tax=Plantibacter sp. YIM 135347 TaxID=3423919 RepID=UPI003D32B667
MQWWNDFVEWLTSSEVRPVLFAAAVFIVAVVVSVLLAAGVSRRALKGIVDQRDREQKNAAIAALIDAATEASVWNSLTPHEQVLNDRAVAQADILVRLSPIKGAAAAADWANHQLHEMKRNSATFGYELDPVIEEFRDRLIDWTKKPSRARKVFDSDLKRWQFESSDSEKALIAQQESWVAQQHHETYAQAQAGQGSPAGQGSQIEPATKPRSNKPIDTSTTQRIIDDVAVLEAERAAKASSSKL